MDTSIDKEPTKKIPYAVVNIIDTLTEEDDVFRTLQMAIPVDRIVAVNHTGTRFVDHTLIYKYEIFLPTDRIKTVSTKKPADYFAFIFEES